MDVRQLKYFVQIVESGSLSKASRQLFIVQPALSQQMARLEEEVGKPLLVRSVRGVVPTQNGEALYHHAKFVLRQLEEAVIVARQEFANVRGRVSVGLGPACSCMLGLPLLRHMKEHYPGILLNVAVALPVHLEERSRHGELDVAILYSKTAASELTFEPLLEEEIFILVPVGSPLVAPGKDSLTLAEVAALPLVLASPYQNLRRRLMLEFERNGLEPNISVEIDSLQLMMRLVAEGGGATVQSMAATQTFGLPHEWRCLRISDVSITRPNYLYALPLQKLSAAASIVRTEIRHVVQDLVTSGTWQGVRLTPPATEAAEPAEPDG